MRNLKVLLVVEWTDALSQLHADIGSPAATCLTRTVGWLEAADEEYLVVMTTYNELGGCDRVIIPTAMVKKITEMKKDKRWKLEKE